MDNQSQVGVTATKGLQMCPRESDELWKDLLTFFFAIDLLSQKLSRPRLPTLTIVAAELVRKGSFHLDRGNKTVLPEG